MSHPLTTLNLCLDTNSMCSVIMLHQHLVLHCACFMVYSVSFNVGCLMTNAKSLEMLPQS